MRMTKKSELSQKANGHVPGQCASLARDDEVSMSESMKSRRFEVIEKSLPVGSSTRSAEGRQMPASDEWLTTTEAAIYLKIKARTLLQWARQGKLKGYILSGVKRHVWRFRKTDLDATLEVPSVRPEERMVQ